MGSPEEFAALLGPAGHRLLARRHPMAGALASGKGRFVSAPGLLAPRKVARLLAVLEASMRPVLREVDTPIPAAALRDAPGAYRERLPKAMRVLSAELDSPRTRAGRVAANIGLYPLLRSASLHAFAEALSGYPLRRKWGLQVLCYRPGDYAGPHTDHHPDEPLARDGYTDLHLTLCTSGVAGQLLVYERGGHLSHATEVARPGLVNCYRLPFWHYTTPLVARRGAEHRARRWVLLATFLDDV